jgi:hypothetical protein
LHIFLFQKLFHYIYFLIITTPALLTKTLSYHIKKFLMCSFSNNYINFSTLIKIIEQINNLRPCFRLWKHVFSTLAFISLFSFVFPMLTLEVCCSTLALVPPVLETSMNVALMSHHFEDEPDVWQSYSGQRILKITGYDLYMTHQCVCVCVCVCVPEQCF